MALRNLFKVAFALASAWDPSELLRALNAVLPEDVRGLDAASCDEEFHARRVLADLAGDDAEQMQLTPDAGLRARRFNWFAFGAVILLGVAVIKIAVAIDRARYNIAFLVILTAIVLWAAWRLVSRRRTSLVDRMLKDLRRLFRALRRRAWWCP